MIQVRNGSVLLLVGASKGRFVFQSDTPRKKWSVEGPQFKGLIIHHFTFDPRDRETFFAATFPDLWGGDMQRSRDGGRTRRHTNGGMRSDAESGLSVKCVWHIRPDAQTNRASLPACVRPDCFAAPTAARPGVK
jgi:hypothetical protein